MIPTRLVRSFRACLTAVGLLSVLAPLAAQGVDTFHNRNLPAECDAKMEAFEAAGHRIRCVAFPPAGGNRWTIVTDRTFFNRNVPSELHAQMQKFAQAGHEILCVAYPPAGGNRWSIVTNRTFFNRNVPSAMHAAMQSLVKAGHKLRWVAFPPQGGDSWSVITDRGFLDRNVPSECHSQMVSFQKAGHDLRCVAFPKQGGNRWTVVTDKGFFNRNSPAHLHETMRAMTRFPGGPLTSVAFTPAGNGFTAISGANPLGNPSTIVEGAEYWSIDRFAANLEAQARAKGMKAGFAMRRGNAVRSFATGLKRTVHTAPEQRFSVFDRFNPASVAKTVTAVALHRALQNRNVSVDTSIHAYLPLGWSKPSSIRGITFRQLLNHTSGFRTPGYGYYYDDLKRMVAAGVKSSDKVFKYENVNYALMRILVAYLDGHKAMTGVDQGKATAARFRGFVKKYLTDPCGLHDVTWTPTSVEPTLFFPDPPGTSKGTTYGDWALRGGGAGIQMSLAEFVIFLDKLQNTTTLISAARRTEMDNANLGWDGTTSVKHGSYNRKGGFFPGSKNGGAELRARIASFDNGLLVACVVNGDAGFDLTQAYDAAWAPRQIRIRSVTSAIANVTSSSLLVSGTNMDAVESVRFGVFKITSQDSSDATKPYFRILSSGALSVHTPQGLLPNTYALTASSALHTSNAVNVRLVLASKPALVAPSLFTAGQNMPIWVARGTRVQGNLCALAVSTSGLQSILPGVVSLEIGNGFRELWIWPQQRAFISNTLATSFSIPTVSGMKGGRLHFEGLVLGASLPLVTTNAARVVFR